MDQNAVMRDKQDSRQKIRETMNSSAVNAMCIILLVTNFEVALI